MIQVLDYFRRRRSHYRMTFGSVLGRQVLGDLQEFCCADSTTARNDSPHQMAIREGRRQVWLRIQRALHLSPEEMFAIAAEKDKAQ